MAFRDWLVAVGATPTPGTITIVNGEHTVDAVIPPLAQQWIYGQDTRRNPTKPVVEYFSLTTPVGSANVCGRMVFSDVHVSQGGGTNAAVPFPTRCGTRRSVAAAEGAGVHAVRSVVVRADRNRGARAAAAPADGNHAAAARHHPGAARAAAAAAAAAAARNRIATAGRG